MNSNSLVAGFQADIYDDITEEPLTLVFFSVCLNQRKLWACCSVAVTVSIYYYFICCILS